MQDSLSKATQENVLTILCFDPENCHFVKDVVAADVFDPPYYRTIAKKAIAYIERFKAAPLEHIADELEDQLADQKLGDTYKNILNAIFNSWERGINSKYILGKLVNFIEERKFTLGIIEAANLQKDGKLEEAKALMRSSIDFSYKTFEPGLTLRDFRQALINPDDNAELYVPTGIKEIDHSGVGLVRQQATLFQAPLKKGKTQFCVMCGKKSALANFKVAHLSLEIKPEIVLQRYIQSILSLTQVQYHEVLKAPVFKRDGNGDIIGVEMVELNRPALDNEDIEYYVEEKLERFGSKLDNIRIKGFEPKSTTEREISAYLDFLEKSENFVPDLLIVDYLGQMKLDIKNYRLSIADRLLGLRQVAHEHNAALLTPVQSNREGFRRNDVTTIGEALMLAQHADTILTFNQTTMEERLKLARVSVTTRAGKGNFSVLLTQNYDTCTFMLDSAMLPSNYDPRVNINEAQDAEGDNEDEPNE